MGHILRRPPQFAAPTDAAKIELMRTFLYQTIADIEFELNSLDTTVASTVVAKETDANSTFSLIKPMIIRSSDIINTYYNLFKSRFDNIYLSQNEYGRHHKVEGSITAFASQCFNGITFISTGTSTEGLPDDFGESVGTVQVINSKVIIQITDIRTGKMASRAYYSGDEGWQSWKVLIPE